MCGIAGILKFGSPTAAEDLAAVRRMMNAQIRRGPDGEGLFRDERVVLGHRRLSIIDRSDAGRQPMSNEICVECGRGRGSVWVTYNGEIYNFQELRDELMNRGHLFRSKTDTEALVHGYAQWGIDGLLARLRGMFAFALYEASNLQPHASRLFLARDRFGIKPLYYHRDRERLIFASEVRALMKSRMVPDEKNVEALVRFLQLGSVPAPLTTVKDVLSVPAGHYLAVADDREELKPYWDLSTHLRRPPASNLQPSNVPISTTRSLLEDSVRRHLVGDVPLGLFLSGGIDSSSIAALAARFHYRPLATLSVVFDERDYDEAGYARLVAERYGTDHREVRLRAGDFHGELPRIFDAMDQPTIDGVNTYFVSKAAKEAGLTVVLSGTGGDEVFLGYDHFRKTATLERTRRFLGVLPLRARRTLIRAAIRAGLPSKASGREKLTYLDAPSDGNLYLLFRGLFAPRRIQDLLGISEAELGPYISQPPTSALKSPTPASLLASFALFEFGHYLQNQLLKDIDIMSMAHSIETRVPFLDHRLVEYVAGLPDRVKLRRGVNKPLLVKALGADLPREVWKRPKMGFTFPFGEWMKERADELQARSLEQKIFDRRAVECVWDEFKKGRAHWSRPWALVTSQTFMTRRND